MSAGDIVILGASKISDSGVPIIQASVPIGDDSNDVEPFGEIESFQSLGVTSVPYGKDDNGYCEAAVLRNVGGRDAVIVGARDTRTAGMVGKAEPGDTVVHSTGPNQAAQIQLKEKRRQVVIATKDSGDEGILINIDGTDKVVQIMAFGGIFEMTPDGITISNGDASILLQGKTIALAGDVILGGTIPNPAMKLMMGPPTGSPGGVASVPLMAAMGISPAAG